MIAVKHYNEIKDNLNLIRIKPCIIEKVALYLYMAFVLFRTSIYFVIAIFTLIYKTLLIPKLKILSYSFS